MSGKKAHDKVTAAQNKSPAMFPALMIPTVMGIMKK
jgi:hypothetical protein